MLVVSNEVPEQYQSVYVDSISGSTTAQMVYSTGAANLFRFGRKKWSLSVDAEFDQIPPISMLGTEYVTFPSFPLDDTIMDHYSVVAVYSNTIIKVDKGEGERAGFCSMAFLREDLFRTVYQLAIVTPLKEMTSVYIVAVVRMENKGQVIVTSGTNDIIFPDSCQDVEGTNWAGCYFHLDSPELGEFYTVEISTTTSSIVPFGAYLYAAGGQKNNVMCFQLGIAASSREHLVSRATVGDNLVEEQSGNTLTSLKLLPY
ncbi:hypothetical protein ElyMa_005442400 [Elysia marginata]|uniref:IgGFc-binding protein N-terminal domain-containing protein n=1 Tax=Elysia marginata TaxID=1093978 RepID=A0AAV4EMM0_9GAST|nr:hypothetical protein ElyMa_005442400 [Elysia marginata]